MWGRLREEYLRANKSEEYSSLISNGELGDYLASVQEEYSARAEKMAEELARERGINAQLYKTDSLKWLLDSEKNQLKIYAAGLTYLIVETTFCLFLIKFCELIIMQGKCLNEQTLI